MKNDKYKKLEIFHFANLINKNLPVKKKKGLIFGNFGAMNFGDEAILAGELEELRKIPYSEITVVSRNPENTKHIHKVQAISLYGLIKIIKEISQSDFVIVGGGGIVCKTDRSIIGFIYQLYMLLLYLFLPKVFGKKVYTIGLGIYSNSNPIILRIATFLLKFCEIVTVRDYHSLQYLNSKQVPASLYKDNSYLMDLLSKSEILKDKFFRSNYNPNKKNVGLALNQPENKNDEMHLISEVEKLINKSHRDTNYWFYSCDYQDNFFNDKRFAQKICSRIGRNAKLKKSLIIVPTDISVNKFFSSFKLMDSFIATRLHGAIFSYRNNIPFLGMTYDVKCSSFLSSIGKTPITIETVSIVK